LSKLILELFLFKSRPSHSCWCYWWPNPRSWSDKRLTCRRLSDAQVTKSVLGISIYKKVKKYMKEDITSCIWFPCL